MISPDFRLNLDEFRTINDTMAPTLVQKGVLLEILSICWLSQSPGESGMSAQEIAQRLGCTENDISSTTTLYSSFGWLVEELEMSTFEVRIKSPMLIKQHAERMEALALATQESKRAKRVREIEEKRLMSLVNREKLPNEAPRVAYLDAEERVLTGYKGWLPTTRFEKSGEVFRITEDYLDSLKQEFPDVDVNARILEIHEWLAKNDKKRKTLAKLPTFIDFWIKNNKDRSQVIASPVAGKANQLSLEDELKKLMEAS
jgi:hypothetical protein